MFADPKLWSEILKTYCLTVWRLLVKALSNFLESIKKINTFYIVLSVIDGMQWFWCYTSLEFHFQPEMGPQITPWLQGVTINLVSLP